MVPVMVGHECPAPRDVAADLRTGPCCGKLHLKGLALGPGDVRRSLMGCGGGYRVMLGVGLTLIAVTIGKTAFQINPPAARRFP